MIEKTLAKRYAAALLAAAEKEGASEQVGGDLLALKEAYLKDAPFRAALSQPRIPCEARRLLLRRPFEGRSCRSFLDFLDLVVRKNRVKILPDVADVYRVLADVSHGMVRVQVRSYLPLTAAQRGALHEKLARITGKKVEIEEQADRSLRGGVSVRIGDTVIDGTVAHRLKALSEKLLEPVRR